MHAIILDKNDSTLSDEYLIEGDDDFGEVELKAKSLAQSGTDCCIKWFRDADGQEAFWGPQGACLGAYWYQ